MSYSPPPVPSDIPDDIVRDLDNCSPAQLRSVAKYAEELAEYREREERLSEEQNGDDAVPEDTPDDVPAKATITIKEINENRYYYWQWREGDKIKSKYKGPVNADE
ncbi:hypothetical protein [Halovenus marina]|uniref:hypothetical protein n=1 Tax=Halovenus marina TaxID=3396621 RepID=UPI003F5590CD